jgi:hypothetical protein
MKTITLVMSTVIILLLTSLATNAQECEPIQSQQQYLDEIESYEVLINSSEWNHLDDQQKTNFQSCVRNNIQDWIKTNLPPQRKVDYYQQGEKDPEGFLVEKWLMVFKPI